MSMTNQQIFDRLQELGCDPPPINHESRIYGLAIIYNSELESNIDHDENLFKEETMEYNFIYKNSRLISPKFTCQVDWDNYFSNTKKDTQSGLRYGITQWEGQRDDIVVEFKLMRLNEDSEYDERIKETRLVVDQLIDNVCSQEISYEIDDQELAAWADIFEKDYYGYVTDKELVEAMTYLFFHTTHEEKYDQSQNIVEMEILYSPLKISTTQTLEQEDDNYIYF